MDQYPYQEIQCPVKSEMGHMKPQKAVCLALGHGGARCLAHIGVLQVLQEEKIRVSRIAGTSGGAIVGSMFALTLDALIIEEKFRELIESEPYERMGLSRLSRSRDIETNFWDQISTRIKGTVAMHIAQSRMSILKGDLYVQCLEILIGTRDFLRCRLPFLALATDLTTGLEVPLSSGDLIEAVRASSAIPGFLPPVNREDHLLADGAICCPVPVCYAGDPEKDVIIAVEVSPHLTRQREHHNALEIMVRAEEINLHHLSRQQTRQADIQIHPDTGTVSWNEIHRIEEAVAAGRAAAKKVLPEIHRIIQN
ncbi:MAG: patatin-like phospholipase family protein [Desulfohalobiaceae bacterium]|nr:patatin-like phospholipase family protein [Desulfohalobiaceae bacterium]